MTTLAEHQFEILPTAEATDGFVFGIGAHVSVDEGGFDPGTSSWMTQDASNSRRGVTGFGRDVRGATPWSWSSHVNRHHVRDAISTLEEFSDAWSPEELVRQPGEVTALRYRVADRDRRIFGRPRRFSAPPSNQILNGYVPVTHDFERVDGYTYDDIESDALISYASSVEGGGFTLPSTFPVATVPANGNGSGQVTVTGTARTYPIIRLNGPWTNPVIMTDSWSLSWSGSIPVGAWVEIDTRPWRLTILDQTGASAAEGLARRTFLEDCFFAPRTLPQISLGGIAAGASASAWIRWRNAWKSL